MSVQKFSSTEVGLDHLYDIARIVTQTSEWKPALNEIASLIRASFIFDNLVVYLADPARHDLDVMYARAMGRGRSAEADISWGETIANQIMDEPGTRLQEPVEDPDLDRLERPYILGIPLKVADRVLGALVFIRFGGPRFEPETVHLSEFIAQQIALLVERQNLQQAYQLLEQQHQESRLQEDFISTITHELRTPLGFIKGYTTTLLRSDTNWDHETQQEFLRIIDQEADRLQDLIENLLDSARLQSGNMKMDFQSVRLDTLVRSIADRIKLHHADLKVHCNPDQPPVILRADPKRLGQVLENLLNNAVKYAPGSDVWVTIDMNENQENVVIHIHDQGPGISQRYLPHIFERFFRNPDLEPYIHGSGLGLFICKKIVQAHHGQIEATSTVGEGTTFHIMLPYPG